MFSKLLLLFFALAAQFPNVSHAATAPSPILVVNLRMDLYNARDVDALLDLYGDDISVYAYPDRLLGTGKAHMRRVLEDALKDSTGVTISKQIENGNHVISEENVTYAGKARRYISIYEVREGLIRSVRFIRE